jgi:hypothetical protein
MMEGRWPDALALAHCSRLGWSKLLFGWVRNRMLWVAASGAHRLSPILDREGREISTRTEVCRIVGGSKSAQSYVWCGYAETN